MIAPERRLSRDKPVPGRPREVKSTGKMQSDVFVDKLPYMASESTLPSIKNPIERAVSARLAILVTLVTILVGIASYFYSMASTEELIREQLIKYIGERGLRESALFLESNAYQARFQKEYVERYKRMGDTDPIEWFEEHMERRPEDGTYRSKPELYHGKDRELGRRDVSASMAIGANARITPEVRRAIAVGYDMVVRYGPAWRKPFLNLYYASPEKITMDYWPGTPWGLIVDDKVEWREEEWFAITTVANNPERRQRWSGVLYDERDGNWMISGVTPLDIEGKQVGLVGTDLPLDDLVRRTINETLSGTYNILMQTDGRIIAHPLKVDEIIAAKGMLSAQTSGDGHLQRIYELTRTATVFPIVIDNKNDDEFISATQINGPDWYFVTIYPKSLLANRALRSAGFIFISGVISVTAMFVVIWLILKRNLVYPLGKLTQAVRSFEIPRGQWSNRGGGFVEKASALGTREDEIGLLARSFVEMDGRLRATYDELEASKEDAEKANKAKSEFLASMSHDLRTPLNAIMGFSEMMMARTFGPLGDPRYEEYASDIYKSGKTLISLINGILDLSKIEAGMYKLDDKPLNVVSLIDDAVSLVTRLAEEKNITVGTAMESDIPLLHADDRAISQVFNNLLSNAVKFTPEGGKITVSARMDGNGGLAVGFADTGIGMSEQDIVRALQPFEQVNSLHSRKHEGTGLGLFICCNLMQIHGGSLTIDSEVGTGTTVTARFPPKRTIAPS